MSGYVSLIGAGPGDEGLITLKALDCICRADVLMYDSLIPPGLINHAGLNAKLIYAGKRFGKQSMTQSEISTMLIREAQCGQYVVRLKGGDPFVFGRGSEEALALKKAGIDFEVVPGISSSYAVPSYAGIPVTDRNTASAFHVITGHERPGKGKMSVDYSLLANEEGTLVFLMGLNSLEEIMSSLVTGGMKEDTPAAVIESGTTCRQRVCIGTVQNITEKVSKAGLSSPAVIVVGDVVSLGKCIGSNPGLKKSRAMITGSRSFAHRLAPKLKKIGVEPVALSIVETVPMPGKELEQEINDIGSYSWILFTSANGIRIFFDTFLKSHDIRLLSHMHFAVIGSACESELRHYGFFSDFVPTEFTSVCMAKEWVKTLTPKDRVLFACAVETSPVIIEELDRSGIACTCVKIYRTIRDMRRTEECARQAIQCDYVILGSSSAALAYADIVSSVYGLEGPKLLKDVRLISIGPETTKACKNAGLNVHKTSEIFDSDGIVSTIKKDGI